MIWILAAFVAFFIKGLCGFANTLVFTSILGFGSANVDISPVELLLGFPPNVIQTYKNRKNLKPQVVLPLIALVLAGSILGALLLKNVNVNYLKVAFGAAVVIIGIEMLLREKSGKKGKSSKIVLFIIGLISGILCGLFGVGALLAAYVGRVTESTDEFKANIGAVFLSENVVRIMLYSFLGIITFEAVKHALILAPVMLLGLFAGMKSAKVLNEKVIKKIVILLLIASGIVLIINNI